MYGYPYGFYFDPTYILLIIGLVISLIASTRMKSTFSKYRRVRSDSGLTGAQTAERILAAAGIYDVKIVPVQGSLTDHYDPRTKTVSLSQDVYGQTSVASVCVAAHECGHAIQDKENYIFFKIRSALVPVVNFVSYLGYFGLLISIIGGLTGYIKLSIIILLATVLFQLVTLPVEIDASKRALVQLEELNLVYNDENKSAKKVLSAAAMTYIASLLSSILDLLRLILILNSRNDDRR